MKVKCSDATGDSNLCAYWWRLVTKRRTPVESLSYEPEFELPVPYLWHTPMSPTHTEGDHHHEDYTLFSIYEGSVVRT
jgi:hypothetical protein